VIADVREKYPAVYLRTVASLVPRDQPGPPQGEFNHLSDCELLEELSEDAKLFLQQSWKDTEKNAGS